MKEARLALGIAAALLVSGCVEQTPSPTAPPSGPAAAAWQKYPGNPVHQNHPTDPEKSFIGDPEVLYRNGTFYMWYASLVHFYVPDTVPYGPCNPAAADVDPPRGCALPMEMATSTDGVTWKRFDRGTPDRKDDYILVRDSENSWDSGSLETPSVFYDEVDGRFKMWFSATKQAPNQAERFLTHRIGYAESPDGIAWKKYDDPATTGPPYAKSDPVLAPRPDGWDSLFVSDPSVLKDGPNYKMWYGGAGKRGLEPFNAIGYAESDDGIRWTRRDSPVLEPTGDEKSLLNGVEVIKTSDTYEMFYYSGRPGIYYATSKDGVNWERKGLLIPPGKSGDWDEFEASSPSVVSANGKLWLYYTGDNCTLEGRCASGAVPHIKIGLATEGG